MRTDRITWARGGVRSGVFAGLILLSAFAVSATASAVEAPPSSGRAAPARFAVEWHEQLYRPPLLEYAARERSRPVVQASLGWVFVADRFGGVRAIDPAGERRWETQVGGPVEAGLLLHEDKLYVATTRGMVHALDARDGTSLWSYRSNNELATTPTIAEGRLLVPGMADTLLVLDADDGEFLWLHRRPRSDDLTIRGSSRAVAVDGRVFVGFSDGVVSSLALEDGRVIWSRQIGTGDFADVDATPVVLDDAVYVASYSGALVALDLRDGRELWSRRIPVGAVRMVGLHDRLFFAGAGFVEAARAVDGATVWEAVFEGGVPSELTFARRLLVFGTEEGPLFGLSLASGRPIAGFSTGTGLTAGAAAAHDGVWAWSNGGWLYKLSHPDS